ncbi:hypothetical protein [Sphingomonas sp.]|uniref:hypothetical protein n=1 Tax=Sphingomonas sp. TaxID=28214 RepID=UPI0025FE975C|nr:hypothetical protein [Sphingomonas sp.]
MKANLHQRQTAVDCPERASAEPSSTYKFSGERFMHFAIIPRHRMLVPARHVVSA